MNYELQTTQLLGTAEVQVAVSFDFRLVYLIGSAFGGTSPLVEPRIPQRANYLYLRRRRSRFFFLAYLAPE